MKAFSLSLSVLFQIIIISNIGFAQQDSTLNISSYFEGDSDTDNYQNILKISPFTIIGGEVSIIYERVIVDFLTIEGSVGRLLPYYIPDIMGIAEGDILEIDKMGLGWYIMPKIFFARAAPELGYFGLQYRRRSFNEVKGKTQYSDINCFYGFQKYINKHWMLDMGYSFGLRKATSEYPRSDDRQKYFIVNYTLKFGYIF